MSSHAHVSRLENLSDIVWQRGTSIFELTDDASKLGTAFSIYKYNRWLRTQVIVLFDVRFVLIADPGIPAFCQLSMPFRSEVQLTTGGCNEARKRCWVSREARARARMEMLHCRCRDARRRGSDIVGFGRPRDSPGVHCVAQAQSGMVGSHREQPSDLSC